MNKIALIVVIVMLVALATAPAHADIESERMAAFEERKWWVGKNLEAGDAFVYEVCYPGAFSGLYGQQPWSDRCSYVLLHFVTLLLADAGPKWIVQVALVDSSGGRLYDVYGIDASTMRIDGLNDDGRMASTIQRTVLDLTEFTGNGRAKPLIVGESWGTSSASSPAVKFVVRQVTIDDREREVFLAGYATTTATSVHRLALDEPFPLGAEVYNPHRLQSGSDRLYSYDLAWSGNSIRDDIGTNEWHGAMGDARTGGGLADYFRSAHDRGAVVVFDICALDDPEHDESPTSMAESYAGINAGSDVPVGVVIVEASDTAEAFVEAIDDVEYCVDLLDFEGYTVMLQLSGSATVTGPDQTGQHGPNGSAEDGLFDLLPDIDGIQPEGVSSLESEHFGSAMPDSPIRETLPEVPAGVVLEDTVPEEAVTEDISHEGIVPGAADADETNRPSQEDRILSEMIGAVTEFFGKISGFLDGMGEALGGITEFFDGVSGVFDDLMGVFVVPAAHAQSDDDNSDDNDGNVVQRLLDIIAGNGTADDIRDGILAEIPGVQDLLQSKNNDGPTFGVDDSVWIPTKMIKGLTYEGMVLLDDAANYPRTIILVSSDQDVLSVKREITVQAGRNTAIFDVVANSGGVAKVYAVMGGKSLSTDEGTVYEINTAPYQIMLVAPGANRATQDGASMPDDLRIPDDVVFPDGASFNDAITLVTGSAGITTGTDTVPVFIYVLDQNGAPAVVETDMELSLGASTGITVPETVVILAGTNHVRIVAGIDRSGLIHAVAPGLHPSTIGIDRMADTADIRLAVAPTVISEGSAAYYYVWLEKDGRPYTPERVMDVQLVSTDRSVAGFDRAHTDAEIAGYGNTNTVKDDVITIQMAGGFARGLVYTGDAGIATLTASISQYGTASYGVRVGAAGISDAGLCAEDKESVMIGRPDPTNLVVWLMPYVTDSVAYAVVAQYHIANVEGATNLDSGGMAESLLDRVIPDITSEELQAQELSAGLISLSPRGSGGDVATAEEEEEEGCVATPVPFTEQFITVSSDGGATHDRTYGTLHQYGIRGAAIEFPIEFQTTGKHTIQVTGNEIGTFGETGDLFGSWTDADEWAATIQVEKAHVDDYSLGITPLPFDSDRPSDVAMVYLQDGQGSIVEVNSLPLRTKDLVVSQTTSNFEIERYDNAFILISGLNKTDDVSVSTAAIPPASQRLVPADKTVGTHIDVPRAVHVGEEFPYAMHEINGNGVPLRIIDSPDVLFGGSVVESRSGSRLVAEDSGVTKTITVIGMGEPLTEVIDVGRNKLDFEIDIDADDDNSLRVGKPVLLRLISDVAGIDYTISWPSWAEYEQVGDNEYSITPNRAGNDTISIVGEKRGYGTERGSVNISAIHEVNVIARAESNGKSIPIKPEIANIEDDSDIGVPYTGPPVYAHVKYPLDYITQTGEGYLFAGMEINGEPSESSEFESYLDTDTRFMGKYERQIFIDILDAQGGGVYRLGDEVMVSAPDREKASFLIIETFSHWEGDLSGKGRGSSFTFGASEDIYAVAIYKEVHAWMGIMFAAAAVIAILAVFRKSDRLKWMFAGLSGLGKMRPKRNSKGRKTKSAKETLDDGAKA